MGEVYLYGEKYKYAEKVNPDDLGFWKVCSRCHLHAYPNIMSWLYCRSCSKEIEKAELVDHCLRLMATGTQEEKDQFIQDFADNNIYHGKYRNQ